jgi:hypothetical protein
MDTEQESLITGGSPKGITGKLLKSNENENTTY